jgi:UrcA family protein
MTVSLMRGALVASLCVATPALADAPATRSVQTGDLNLASATGQDVLDRRLRFAARAVCQIDQSRDLTLRMKSVRCFRETMANARMDARTMIVRRAVNAPVEVASR